jgi:hypothetical protein
MTPLDWLRTAGAQGDVIDGLARFPDWQTLWRECPRGDWLLGIAERIGVPHDALVGAAIGCARLLDLDEPALHVIARAEQWIDGAATAAEVAAAVRALEENLATAVDPSVEAAGRAALAVGLGVAEREYLAAAPAAAAESVMMASMDCGFELAMRWAHDKTADAVREAVPWVEFEACIAGLAIQS